MINFAEVHINALAIHKIGNKAREEDLTLSASLFPIETEPQLQYILLDYFTNSFTFEELFQLQHESELDLNVVYACCKQIFETPDQLHEASSAIAKHLYEQSTHPKVKSGELYIAHFTNCLIADELVDAIGIFKSEDKAVFLRIEQEENNFNLDHGEGINTNKLDKGCLIFNSYNEDGYRVLTVDSTNRLEARYWREDFLNIIQVQDNVFHTKNYLSMCKEFATSAYAEEHDKKEQVLFMNKSVDYFSTHEKFDLDEFTDEVINDADANENFRAYKNDFEVMNGLDAIDDFEISPPAVKKMKRRFKNHIKLDTHIEIRLNNTTFESDEGHPYIERGYDEAKNMKYYKVYFNEEG